METRCTASLKSIATTFRKVLHCASVQTLIRLFHEYRICDCRKGHFVGPAVPEALVVRERLERQEVLEEVKTICRNKCITLFLLFLFLLVHSAECVFSGKNGFYLLSVFCILDKTRLHCSIKLVCSSSCLDPSLYAAK